MNKKLVCVIFGGESSEHDVSCISATTVINNIDRDIYDVMLIGITKDGRWMLVDDVSCIKDGSFANGDIEAVILPDKYTQGVLVHNKNDKEKPYYEQNIRSSGRKPDGLLEFPKGASFAPCGNAYNR